MSLVVILNNGRDMVVAADKRIIHTNNDDVVIGVDDNNNKIFVTPQEYVVTFNGNIIQGDVSVVDMIKNFINKTRGKITIESYVICLREYITKLFNESEVKFLDACIQVSGVNEYPITKILQLENMKIVDHNRRFVLCGSTTTAGEELDIIRNSKEYKNGEFDTSVPSMVSLAKKTH